MGKLLTTLIEDAGQLADVEFPEAAALPGLVTALARRLEHVVPDLLDEGMAPKPAEPAAPAAAAAEPTAADSAQSSIESKPAEPAAPAEATVAADQPPAPVESDKERAERLEAELARIQAALAPPAHDAGTVESAQ